MNLSAFVATLGLFFGTTAVASAAVTNRLIATSGDPLPGAPAYFVLDLSLGNATKVINARGDVAFIAPLKETISGSSLVDNALMFAGAGPLQNLGRTGDAIPGVAGDSFGVFNALAIDDAGRLVAKDVMEFDDRLLANLSGAWQVVSRVGTAAPNPPGGNFNQVLATPQIGGKPVLRQSGSPQWLFQATTTMMIPPLQQTGLWGLSSNLQPYQALAYNGPAPGLGGGQLLESNDLVAVTPPPGSATAFRGFLKNGSGGVDFGNRQILYYGTSPETAQVLARTGDPVPPSAGAGNFDDFSGLDANQNGQICFLASWFSTESFSGLFLKVSGPPVLLVKTGDTAPAANGSSAGTFSGFGDAAINAAAQVVFSAFVQVGASEGGGSFNALYRWQSGNLKQLVRVGTNSTWIGAPAGWHFTALKRWNVNASGAVAFFGQARNANNTQTTDGLWVLAGDSGPQLVAYTGTPFLTPPPSVVALSLLRDSDPAPFGPATGGADGRVRFLADSNNAVVFSGSFPFPSTNSAIFVSRVTDTSTPTSSTSPEYQIYTIAGDGTSGSGGDGGLAVQAQLNQPGDVALDTQGHLLIADTGNHRVRVITVGTNNSIPFSSLINTFAGNGTAGYSGDGGQATNAQLNSIAGVAVDAAGNVYLADRGNHCIRRVDPNGIITTIAGTNTPGFSGDDGPANAAQLSAPTAVEVDAAGQVYIADSGNYRIRRVDTNGTITTIAGNGTNGFSGTNGPATEASLRPITALTLDAFGNLYLTQTNDLIRRVDVGGTITTFAGSGISGYSGNGGPAIAARLRLPSGLAVDSGFNLFIADDGNNRIRYVGFQNIMATVAGNGLRAFGGDNGFARLAQLEGVSGLATDINGRVFLCSSNRVRMLSQTTNSTPLLPIYSSLPSPFVFHVLDDVNHSTSLIIGNTGAADLRIDSVALFASGGTSNFSFTASQGGVPATVPLIIPDGASGGSLRVTLFYTFHTTDSVDSSAELRVYSNDPQQPEVVYNMSVRNGHGTRGPTEATKLTLVMAVPPMRLSDPQISSLCPCVTNTFSVDATAPHQVTAAQIPDFLGGGSVVLSNFTGSVSVSIQPIPNEYSSCFVTIEGGTFVAPSVTLPSGLATGPITLTFGPREASQGRLNLADGSYTAVASATISSSLVPQGILVSGTYAGTYNAIAQTITVTSDSNDFIPEAGQLRIVRGASDSWITWSLQGFLEKATNVLGPWTTLSNAASPYAVDYGQESQQFFRVRMNP